MTEATADPDAYETAEAAWGFSEPRPRRWAGGPWALERRGDELADITFDGTPLLRMIRAVVRDRDWNTVPVEVTDVEESGGRLRVALRFRGFGVDLDGALIVETAGESLQIGLALESRTDFDRNRIGLVVLHPPSVAGSALTVTAPDASETGTRFPERISPHQPAMDIAGLAWSADGVDATLTFTGDVFEMEDQRNWTDASFKTYSTPLARPFPVHVSRGERIEQAIRLTATRLAPASVATEPATVVFRPSDRVVPQLALGASTAPGTVPAGVNTLPGEVLLVELVLATPNWPAALERAAEEASGRPLDVRLVAASPAELDQALDALGALTAQVRRLAVFSPKSQITEPELWRALRAGAEQRGFDADLVGGVRSHFTELNRRHPDLPADLPALTFSITPQMHAVERSQIVESIAMQRLVAEDAVRIADGRPVHIGPVTLRARYNAVATTEPDAGGAPTVDAGYGAEHVPGATDPRQRSEALAAWTVASAAAVAIPGVESITFFETWGPRGVLDGHGAPYPVARALEALAELCGRRQLDARGLPAGVWAIAARTPEGDVAVLASLRASPTSVRIEGAGEFRLQPFTMTSVRLGEARSPQ